MKNLKDLGRLINAYLGRAIYKLFLWIDTKLEYYDGYEGESAPYCGHHYNGHDGKFTQGRYAEGDGGEWTIKMKWLFMAGYENVEYSSTDVRCYFLNVLPIRYKLRRWFKSVKIEKKGAKLFVRYSETLNVRPLFMRLYIINFKKRTIKKISL